MTLPLFEKLPTSPNLAHRRIPARLGFILAGLLVAVPAAAQTFDLQWHTIDGGGATFSTGGTFQLGGTIGQPDGGSFTAPMSGGSFTLVGGFWPAASTACACPGDVNTDGLKNGLDIQRFVACIQGSGNCDCAEVDGAPGLTSGDIVVFVTDLVAGTGCP